MRERLRKRVTWRRAETFALVYAVVFVLCTQLVLLPLAKVAMAS